MARLARLVRRARPGRRARRVLALLAGFAFVLLLPALWIGWQCGGFGGGTPEIAPSRGSQADGASRAGAADAASALSNATAITDTGMSGTSLPAVRPEDQTYLTLPEWYIVYSADEYAAFLAEHPPSAFPYAQAIRQYWTSYREVCQVTRQRYPFNTGYHVSLYVIGVSFTAEYLVKGIYENLVGRLTEWLGGGQPTAEDAYARAVAEDFGHFIHTVPWYEYPYAEKLAGLWRSTPFWSPNPIRQWERKAALSAEYGGKAVYAWLIKLGTQGAFAPEDLEIQAVVQNLHLDIRDIQASSSVVRPRIWIDDEHILVSITRYEAFTHGVQDLADDGVRFVEIAGNDRILVTLLAPADWTYDLPVGEPLFEMPILTRPEQKRLAIDVPVGDLHRVLTDLASRGVVLEHVYDY